VAFPNDFRCPKCAAILRELKHAGEADFEERKENWLASGRSLQELRDQSLASMAYDDSAELLACPRTTAARHKKAEHETESGHNVYFNGIGALWGPKI